MRYAHSRLAYVLGSPASLSLLAKKCYWHEARDTVSVWVGAAPEKINFISDTAPHHLTIQAPRTFATISSATLRGTSA